MLRGIYHIYVLKSTTIEIDSMGPFEPLPHPAQTNLLMASIVVLKLALLYTILIRYYGAILRVCFIFKIKNILWK